MNPPYNMMLVTRGSITMGPGELDSLWGIHIPTRGISVDNFWMDETEITNSQYKQFVYWVRDSIIRERIADPRYAGDDFYRITEDEYGDPVTPRLNWSIPIPWNRNTEEEEAAINSLFVTHPITGQKMLDATQLNFRYEWFDAAEAARRQEQLNRMKGAVTGNDTSTEMVMISKDTAYVNFDGRIVNRPSPAPEQPLRLRTHPHHQHLPRHYQLGHRLPNANNEVYMRNYFAHPPMPTTRWWSQLSRPPPSEWRTMFLRRSINRQGVIIEKYRLPPRRSGAGSTQRQQRQPLPVGDR